LCESHSNKIELKNSSRVENVKNKNVDKLNDKLKSNDNLKLNDKLN